MAFSPDGQNATVAVGYYDVAAVDILDGATLKRVGGHAPADVRTRAGRGLQRVAWSVDGEALSGRGGVVRRRRAALCSSPGTSGGLGDERRTTFCADELERLGPQRPAGRASPCCLDWRRALAS